MRIQANKRKGFSLIECVIAIGLVAVLLTTFMAIFGPAQQNINRALGVSEANRLVTTLENEMAILRDGEETDYVDSNGSASAFEKAFQWVNESHDQSKAIVVYQYQALPNEYNSDDTLQPVSSGAGSEVVDDSKLPGVDYITQTMARRVDSDFVEDELQAGVVEGTVYAVRMTQLVRDTTSGALELLDTDSDGTPDPGLVNATDTATTLSDSSEFADAYITLQVEFFALPTNLATFVQGNSWTFDSLGKPVAVQNIAVRR